MSPIDKSNSGSVAALRWGIVGTGSIADTFANDLVQQRGVRLSAVLSRTKKSASAFGARYGTEATVCTADVKAFAEACDVAYIATPHTRHHEDAMTCLRNGLHVLVEKPMALSAVHAAALTREAEERGLFLMEALWTRFLPASVALREQLQKGDMGPVRTIDVDHGFDGHNSPARLMDPTLGGGSWFDLGSYVLNIASDVLDAVSPGVYDKPEVLSAHAKLNQDGVDEETCGALVYNAKNGAAPPTVVGFRTACMEATSNTATIHGPGGSVTIHAPYHHPSKFTWNGVEHTHPISGHGLWYQTLEAEACIAAGKQQSALVPWAQSVAWADALERVRSTADVVPVLASADTLAGLRVAVLGCGRIGKVHIANLRRLKVGTIMPVDINDALPVKGQVDAIVIASPSALHHTHMRLAMELNVPVYCEKPLCDTWEATTECVAELHRSGIRVQMGFQRRFDPHLARVQSCAGALKPLQSVTIISRDPKPPPPEYVAQMGSHFADMTVHDYDEARWMLGAEPVRIFAALDGNKDRSTVVMRTADGQQCQIVNDRHCAFGYDQRVELLGKGGVARHDRLPDNPDVFFEERYKYAYLLGMQHFLTRVVLKGEEPPVTPLDAMRAANLARACDLSVEVGKEVDVPEIEFAI